MARANLVKASASTAQTPTRTSTALPDVEQDADLARVAKDAAAAWKLLEDRREHVTEWRAYYSGTHDEIHANDAIQDALKHGGGPIYGSNICKPIADDVWHALKFETTEVEGESADSRPKTEAFRKVWKRTRLGVKWPSFMQQTARDSRATMMVWQKNGKPLYYVLGALDAGVLMDDDDDTERRCGFRRKYESGRWTMRLVYRDAMYLVALPESDKLTSLGGESSKVWDKYTIETTERDESDPNDDGTRWKVPHGFGFVPMWEAVAPDEEPEHMQAIGAQNAITKLMHEVMAVSDANTLALRYGLSKARTVTSGASDSAGMPTPRALIDEETGAEVNEDEYRKSVEQVTEKQEPGDFIYIPGIDSVVEMTPQDVEKWMGLAKFFIERAAFSSAAGAYMLLNTETPPSGAAARVLLRLNTDKKGDRRDVYGVIASEIFSAGLWIELDIQDEDEREESVVVGTFTQDGQIDILEQIQIGSALESLGVPADILLSRLGEDPTEAKRWVDDKAKRAVVAADLQAKAEEATGVQRSVRQGQEAQSRRIASGAPTATSGRPS